MIEVFCTRALHKTDYEKAKQKGIKITSQNFIRIVPILSEDMRKVISTQLRHPDQTLLFTSKNAACITLEYYLASIPDALIQTWKIYGLSHATKHTLLTRFEEKQIIGSADHAAALTKKIAMQDHTHPIHFFCGNRRRKTLPDFMQNHHIPYKEWVVYQTKNTSHPVSKNYRAYLFYSPSAVESFFSLNNIGKNVPCFSIGQTTTKALKARIENPVYTSGKPDTDHLLQTLSNYFKTEA